jgi:hypothetical protein
MLRTKNLLLLLLLSLYYKYPNKDSDSELQRHNFKVCKILQTTQNDTDLTDNELVKKLEECTSDKQGARSDYSTRSK